MTNENEKKVFEWGRKYPAPAKLNLMLRIIGQREDGYHLLQTIFQFVDWCDWLTFFQNDSNEIILENEISGVENEDNLIVKAAKLLKFETGYQGGVTIQLEKNLPMGGGLGGGSSDAATTLVVLNSLWNLQLSHEKLMELGLSLGADVPVFIFGKAAWAEGVGEKLTEINLKEQWVLIINPGCAVNTKRIFSDKNLTRNSKSITIKQINEVNFENDCLDVVCKQYEAIDLAFEICKAISDVRLTGTGCCLFSLFSLRSLAIEAQLKIKEDFQFHVARMCNKSPLFTVSK